MNHTRKANRLINEKSPYLLQHAYNPVDWQPWSDAVLERAREEDRPIFLSIGYSTCHWCHVMAHESFEDEAVAARLNRFFIPVKVDREERPDLDRIYMTATQAMTGSGGWPLSIFLLPDASPFSPAPTSRRRRWPTARASPTSSPPSNGPGAKTAAGSTTRRADHRLPATDLRHRSGRGAARPRPAAQGSGSACGNV